MLFHMSIAGRDPRHVAEVIAEIWGGEAFVFPPVAEGSWIAIAGDDRGTALEVYDYLVFAYFALFIGQAFFPSDNPTTTLLASLATFAGGFITRPLGAIVIGRMGDRIGRKPAMLLSFMLLGIATLALALTPSYAQIGLAAPILAVLFRMLQGFALGGEMGPSTTYLIEAAPPERRGFFVSLQYTAMGTAGLTAGLMGVGMASLFDADGLRDYGWRIAMLVGVAVIPVGLILRRTLVETLPELPPDAGAAKPEKAARHLRLALLGLVMMSAGATVAYVLAYFATYAITTLKLTPGIAFGATALNGLVGVVGSLIGGMLSDRFGRKPVMMTAWVVMLVSIYPMFFMIIHFSSAEAIYLTQVVVGGAGSIGAVSVLVAVTESFPARMRSGAVSLVFALSTAVFAGSAQFNVVWLTSVTGSPYAPAWYVLAWVALGLVAMSQLAESAPRRAARLAACAKPALQEAQA